MLDLRPPLKRTIPRLSICGIESAARLLIHARNNHGALRATIRAAIHADITLLRSLHRV